MMEYTKKQLDHAMRESVKRENALVQEYRRTHQVPSCGIIFISFFPSQNL